MEQMHKKHTEVEIHSNGFDVKVAA